MKTSLAVRLEELIRGTDDKKFFQIYNDLMDFKKVHFIEFKFINRISLLNDLVNIIEDEMDLRDGIEQMAVAKVKKDIEDFEKPKSNKKQKVVEDWKQSWMEENEQPVETSAKSDFKMIMLCVVIIHIMGFSVLWGYNQYQENVRLKQERIAKAEASPYPLFPDYDKIRNR
jgi:hypothetical protein